MNKLPQITLAFWVMKICATTLGETAGDLLSMTLNIGYALSSLLLISVFLLTLLGQLYSRRYHSMLYWLVILSTSTAGTTMRTVDRQCHRLGSGGPLLDTHPWRGVVLGRVRAYPPVRRHLGRFPHQAPREGRFGLRHGRLFGGAGRGVAGTGADGHLVPAP